MKDIPRRQAALFARTWGSLLKDALDRGTPEAWFDYASFPKCILLAPIRGGKRISRVQSRADLVHSRLVTWFDQKSVLWQGVLARLGKSSKSPSSAGSRHDFEKRVLGALRVSDVRKALQMFVAAPIAPKTEETFKALKSLHPESPISLSLLTMHRDSPISTSERLCFPLHQPLLLGCSVIGPPFSSNVLEQNHFILSLP
jgi:hypothetical protein